jgi:uncharacterized protein YkwD
MIVRVVHFGRERAVRLRRLLPRLPLVIGMALIALAVAFAPQQAMAQSFQIFVPMVSTEGSGPGGTSGSVEACGLNAEESSVAQMVVSHASQERDNPVCNPILAQVARGRARDMALRGYFSHTNPDGKGPNLLVREAGYLLPDWYGDESGANNIESIGGGYTSPDGVWQGWLDSEKHRVHVLGTQSFYAGQNAFGIGYYFDPNSPLKHYWVFISAPVE